MNAICHKPVRPPRSETIGEQVFLRNWQMLMAESPSDTSDYCQNTWIEQILYNLYEKITPRHAEVAASLVTWLGTNHGSSLIIAARREIARAPDECPQNAWLKLWAVFNRRSRGLNSGARILEHVLSLPENLSITGEMTTFPVLTSDDYEVAEHLCMWFGTAKGAEFICQAEREVKALKLAARYRCGRIVPASTYDGIVSVWNTPDHSRDSEELCMGGESFGGWMPANDGGVIAHVIKPGGVRVELGFNNLDDAKQWVEGRVAEFVARLIPS